MISTFLLSGLLAAVCSLQAATVSGIVTDEDQNPLADANVVNLLNSEGLTTCPNGLFALVIPDHSALALEISYYGFENASVRISSVESDLTLSVTLRQKIQEIGSISVHARKRLERWLDVPGAVQSVGESQTDIFITESIGELTALAPNVFADENQLWAPDFTIRGVPGGNTGRAGGGSPDGLYVDGIYAGRRMYSNPDFIDFQRIEFLKGPQGTLFGKNSLSGAVNIIMRKPTARPSFSIDLLSGEREHQRLSISGNMVYSQRLFHRVSFRAFRKEDYLKNLYHDEYPEFSGQSLRNDFRILHKNGGLTDVSLDVFRRTLETGRGGNVTDWTGLDTLFQTMGRDITDDGPHSYQSNLQGEDETDGLTAAVTYQNSLKSGFRTVSQTALRMVKNNVTADSDQTALDFLHDIQEREYQLITQELRIHSRENGRLTWLAGLHLLYQDETTDLAVYPGSDFELRYGMPSGTFTGSDVNVAPHTNITDFSAGIFGSADYQVSSRWTLSGGIRFSREKKEMDFFQNGIPLIGYPFIPIDSNNDGEADGSLKEDYEGFAVSPLLSVRCSLIPGANGYAVISRGFKSGGFNTDFVATEEAAAHPFDPEFVTNYESGFKFSHPDLPLTAGLTLYYMDIEDMQVSVYRENEGFRIMNAAAAWSRGLEANLFWKPVTDLALTAAIGWTAAEFERYAYTDLNGLSIDHSGESIGSHPEWTGSLGVDFNRPLHASLELNAGCGYMYQTEYKNLITETDVFFENKARGLLNGYAGIRLNGISFRLWAKNILNEEYTTMKTRDLMLGLKREYWGAPRSAGLEISYSVN